MGGVLILVLVEDGLRVESGEEYQINDEVVLILVLVEDGLRDLPDITLKSNLSKS